MNKLIPNQGCGIFWKMNKLIPNQGCGIFWKMNKLIPNQGGGCKKTRLPNRLD
jgi:hypothetical protein